MHRSVSEGWQGSFNMINFRRSQELRMLCFYKNSRNQNGVFKLKFFSIVFFFSCFFCVNYFSFALWTSSEQQSGRGHISIRLQISKKYIYINHNYEILAKITYDVILNFSTKLFNFEFFRSHSSHL